MRENQKEKAEEHAYYRKKIAEMAEKIADKDLLKKIYDYMKILYLKN